MSLPTDALTFATRLAYEAGAVMKANFKPGMKKEWKDNATPVTVTDHAINKMVLDAVAHTFPEHSYIGEEGDNLKESEYSWVCDPVDGTMPFSLGWPTFVFSLALTHNGESVLGVIYDPICDRLLTAEKGKGAHMNGKPISVSKQEKLGKQTFVEMGGYSVLPHLQEHVSTKTGTRTPSLFSCVYAGMLTSLGEIDGLIYKYKSPWDVASIKIIVEEAGGKVTDLDGNDQRYDREVNGLVASNGLIHTELVQLIQEVKKAV